MVKYSSVLTPNKERKVLGLVNRYMRIINDAYKEKDFFDNTVWSHESVRKSNGLEEVTLKWCDITIFKFIYPVYRQGETLDNWYYESFTSLTMVHWFFQLVFKDTIRQYKKLVSELAFR